MVQSKEIKQKVKGLKNFDIWLLFHFDRCYFWKGGWTLCSASDRLSEFSDVSQFPRILNLKSFGNFLYKKPTPTLLEVN